MTPKILTPEELTTRHSAIREAFGYHAAYGSIASIIDSHEALRAERDALLAKISEWAKARSEHFGAMHMHKATIEGATKYDRLNRELVELAATETDEHIELGGRG